ncbi:MAG: hypothetical protein K6F52_02960 [Clostridia bacterium]|nr:hypothetical protein [Clostridia bacterium]
MKRAPEKALEKASERAPERALEKASERASERALELVSERAFERAFERKVKECAKNEYSFFTHSFVFVKSRNISKCLKSMPWTRKTHRARHRFRL